MGKVEPFCIFKLLVVSIEKSTLGRLFNTLGIIIDIYIRIDELPIYLDYIISFDQYEVEYTTNSFQQVQFSRTNETTKIIKLNIEEELQKLYPFNQLLLKFTLNICTSIRKLTIETIRLKSLGFTITMGTIL